MKRIIGVLAAIAIMLGVSAVPAEAVATCSSSGICFYHNSADLPIAGYNYQTAPLNVCKPVPDNQTRYVDNNTGSQWYVWTGTNCTGTRGTIYAHTEGPMAGVYYDSIGSTKRIS